MSQYPWKPIRLGDLDREIDQAFEELIHAPWGIRGSGVVWQPEIDIYETAESYLVEADIPGVPTEEIAIHVEEHALTISGTRHSTRVEQSAQGLCLERRKGSFFRRFPLEHAVDPQRVERTIHEGTLTLRIPKQKSANPQ